MYMKRRYRHIGPPTCSKRPIALLFLAHSGVTQGPAWEKWRTASKYDFLIHFYVHANEQVRYGKDFVEKYRVPFTVKTEWYDLSLVTAYIKSAKHIVSSMPSIEIVYLVSGSDVPLRCADELFEFDRHSRIAFTGDITFNNFPIHTQWVHLRSEHIWQLPQPGKFEKKYKKYVDDDTAPDEWVVGALLRKIPVHHHDPSKALGPSHSQALSYDIIINEPLTDMERADSKSPSPVLWTSYTKKRRIIRNGRRVPMDFEEVLQESSEDGFFFFRKAGEAIKYEDYVLYHRPHFTWVRKTPNDVVFQLEKAKPEDREGDSFN